MTNLEILKQTKYVLSIIFVIFFLILFRIWHLSVIQKETRLKDAIKPHTRTIIEKANRGCIYDRYDVPLALNRIKYNAAIYYSHIRQIPYVKYIKEKNKKTRIYPRKEYIEKLSNILAKEIDLDPNRIEDLIHSKASIFPHVPFIIKENITEKEYYRLRMLQRDYPGLQAELTQERFYPQKKIASHILGFMGKINQKEYFTIANEITSLQNLLQQHENNETISIPKNFDTLDEVKLRLEELTKLAYGIRDLVGKAGIEKKIEEKLKGYHEKRTFFVDITGNFLKEKSGFQKPLSGTKLTLTISSELQSFAEELLAKDEKIRCDQSLIYSPKQKKKVIQKQPWIKGGSIVVMDPNNGEILAMASYPRFDPNDFIPSANAQIKNDKFNNINQWFETTKHVASIFDGKEKLKKELFSNKYYQEDQYLSLDVFLDFLLEKESPIRNSLEKIQNIKRAIDLEENIEALAYYANEKNIAHIFDIIFDETENNILTQKKLDSEIKENIKTNLDKNFDDFHNLKNKIDPYLKSIKDNRDKLFLIDICRLVVNSYFFSDELITKIGNKKLSQYWDLSKSTLKLQEELKNMLKPLFHQIYFTKWKNQNLRSFIKKKRLDEKQKHKYAIPYLDYLDSMEKKLFNEFYNKNQHQFLLYVIKGKIQLSNELFSYVEFLDDWKKEIENTSNYTLLKNELANLCDDLSLDFLKTARSFYDLDRPLLYNYYQVKGPKNEKLEKHLAASFYPKNSFGYGRSKVISASYPPGSLYKILIAYSALKQRYDYLIQNNKNLSLLNPFSMIDDLYWDSKAKKGGSIVVGRTLDNKPYPRFYKKGRLPKSAHRGIGQVDLVKALEMSSNPYFAILAGDYITTPQDLIDTAKNFNIGKKTNIDIPGEIKGNLPEDILYNKTSLYSFAIGQHSLIVTPLQTAVMLSAIANKGYVFKPKIIKSKSLEIIRKIPIEEEVRNMLLEGMDQVVSGERGSARPYVIKKFYGKPDLKQEYKNLYHQFVGKTSTAEFMYNANINPSSKAQKYKNTWFGSISFEDPKKDILNANKKEVWQKPELVVVVQLHFGDGGKEAAPIAFEMVKKYRELKEKYALK